MCRLQLANERAEELKIAEELEGVYWQPSVGTAIRNLRLVDEGRFAAFFSSGSQSHSRCS